MTVYTPYIKYRVYTVYIYMVLANPTHLTPWACSTFHLPTHVSSSHSTGHYAPHIFLYPTSHTTGHTGPYAPLHPRPSFYRTLDTPHPIYHTTGHTRPYASPHPRLILQDAHRTPPHISHHRARRTICISPPTSHSTGHSSHPTPHITPQGTQHHTWQMIFGQRALAQLAQAVVADSHARMSQYAPWVSARVKCTGAVMLCVTHTKRRLRGGLETFRLPRSASASSSLSSARRHVVLLIGAADLEEGAGKKHTGYASIEF